MSKVLIILALAIVANGFEWDNLKVKYGATTEDAGVDSFIAIPRTVSAAVSEGMTLTERPDGPMQELQMYCPTGRIVCALYTTEGWIAGLQLAMPVQDYTPASTEPQKLFTLWTPAATDDDPSMEYYTSTMYYVSEEQLEAGEGPTEENGNTIQGGGVWVQGPDGDLMKIPATEEEIQQTLYTKQNCIENMGTHYYYNMSTSMDCNKFFPSFGLYIEQTLIGVGFQVIGKMNNQTAVPKSMFEKFTNGSTGIPATIPHAPSCLSEWILSRGIISLHTYFTKSPWELVCNDEDSSDPSTIPAS